MPDESGSRRVDAIMVPANAIAAPPTSAATAQNYAMKKDLDAISGASSDQLGFMTGITGGNGSPPLHHFSALIEILSMVVNSANDVMCLTKN